MRRLLAVLGLVLTFGGCRQAPQQLAPLDGGPEQGLALATELRERYGRAEELDAEIYLVVVPPEQEHVSFSLQLTVVPGVGVVLDAFKKGFEILDGLIEPDGECLLVLQREELVVQGNLDAVAAQRQVAGDDAVGLFVTQLPRIVDEVQAGPVPVAADYRIEPYQEGRALRCINPDGEALCVLDASGQRVDEKIIYRGHGEDAVELLRLSYSRQRVTSTLLRAHLVQVRLPQDATRIVIKLARLEIPLPGSPLVVQTPVAPEGWLVRPLISWLDDLLPASEGVQ